ncbi:MAG: trypsin-like peptidase domain-containing protein [Verrucomicrobiaceae bacterium]|nr:trypsin-like peptidase domain-containing protein [Verrucomicrobiaceae bacterium]
MELVRRLFVAAAILAISAGLYLMSRGTGEPYGLPHLVDGRRPPESGKLAPKLDVTNLDLMRRMSDDFATLAEKIMPCVVSINTQTERPRVMLDPLYGFVAGAEVMPGQGSGVIISNDGLIITNYHVVQNVALRSVITQDRTRYDTVRIVNFDAERDVALLKIDSTKHDFPALRFANSDQARVGQIVFAAGNPFGLGGSLTQGIINARDRQLSESTLDFFQTDAVINPGNSGGPLVDLNGEVVGINTLIFYRGDEKVRAWQGIGLAIPSNDVKNWVDAVLAKQRSQAQADAAAGLAVLGRGYLGIEVRSEPIPINPLAWDGANIGAYVTDIDPNSPAAVAGLQAGDVITRFQGMAFRSPRDLLLVIRTQPVGSQVKLDFIRGQKVMEVNAKLQSRPDMQMPESSPSPAPTSPAPTQK